MQVFILDGVEPVGVLGDAFERLEWTRSLWKPHTITLDLNLRQLHASAILKNRVLFLPDEEGLAFLVEHIETNDEPGAAKDAMRVIGRSIDAIATEERLALPPEDESHDTQSAVPAETAIKHYVDANGGPGAATARQVPNLVVATDQERGGTVTVSARYQMVGDILREVGAAAGMGWETTLDRDAEEYEFEVIPGVDRTASVFFDTAFDTLERYSELDSLLDTKTHAVVAGRGEGADREVVERFLDSEKEGLERREVFVDARDVEGENPGEAVAALETRGDATLEALQAAARYEAVVHPYGSFRYREHWDLGDLVTLRDSDRGLAVPVRVVTVRSSITDSKAAPEREVELDRPFPTLKDRINGGGVSGGAIDSPLSLPPDPHADTHQLTAGDDSIGSTHLITKVPASTAGSDSAYPVGISMFLADAADGYPIDFCWVQTTKLTVTGDRMTQRVFRHSSLGTLSWERSWHSSIGWSPFMVTPGRYTGRQLLKSTSQSIPNAAWTKVTSWGSGWGTARILFSAANNALVIQEPGLYLVRGWVNLSDTSSTGRRLVGFSYASGGASPSATPALPDYISTTALIDSAAHYIESTQLRELAAADQLSLVMWQNSGAAMTLTTAAVEIAYMGG